MNQENNMLYHAGVKGMTWRNKKGVQEQPQPRIIKRVVITSKGAGNKTSKRVADATLKAKENRAKLKVKTNTPAAKTSASISVSKKNKPSIKDMIGKALGAEPVKSKPNKAAGVKLQLDSSKSRANESRANLRLQVGNTSIKGSINRKKLRHAYYSDNNLYHAGVKGMTWRNKKGVQDLIGKAKKIVRVVKATGTVAKRHAKAKMENALLDEQIYERAGVKNANRNYKLDMKYNKMQKAARKLGKDPKQIEARYDEKKAKLDAKNQKTVDRADKLVKLKNKALKRKSTITYNPLSHGGVDMTQRSNEMYHWGVKGMKWKNPPGEQEYEPVPKKVVKVVKSALSKPKADPIGPSISKKELKTRQKASAKTAKANLKANRQMADQHEREARIAEGAKLSGKQKATNALGKLKAAPNKAKFQANKAKEGISKAAKAANKVAKGQVAEAKGLAAQAKFNAKNAVRKAQGKAPIEIQGPQKPQGHVVNLNKMRKDRKAKAKENARAASQHEREARIAEGAKLTAKQKATQLSGVAKAKAQQAGRATANAAKAGKSAAKNLAASAKFNTQDTIRKLQGKSAPEMYGPQRPNGGPVQVNDISGKYKKAAQAAAKSAKEADRKFKAAAKQNIKNYKRSVKHSGIDMSMTCGEAIYYLGIEKK